MDFKKYHLSEVESIITELPGKLAKEILKDQDKFESNNRSYPRVIPLVPEIAQGSIIEDVDGNQFIDFFAGCGVLNLGHNNSFIIQAIEQHNIKIIQGLDFPTRIKIDFMKKLNSQLPKELQNEVKFNFCGPTGADAIEAAIKLARICTKRKNIITFDGAYHGMTEGALSITSSYHHKKDLSHIQTNNIFLPFCYCYRCAFGKDKDNCNIECAQYVRESVEKFSSSGEKPAAIIIEPVQGEGGTIIPRKEFVEQLVKVSREFDIPLIFDEIQAGFYRTGFLFSFQHFSVIPDIITVSKGIGGIGMPLSLLIIRKELDRWDSGTHVGTFRGNQLSIAAGLKALEFAENAHIENYVNELGEQMKNFLLELQRKSKYIGEVRCLGLMFGIEYVKSKKTKEPFPEFVKELRKQCYLNGLLVEVGGIHSNVIRLLPPLISTEKIAFRGLEILQSANNKVEQIFY